MSDDLIENSDGFIRLPRRLPLAIIIVAVTLAFGFGGWATAHQLESVEQGERLDRIEKKWDKVERFMCILCTDRGKFDCSGVCP